MKVKKISNVHIPLSHYKWAGISTVKKLPGYERKNDLDVEKLDKLIKKAYDKKYGTYNRKGEFIVFEEESEVQDRHTVENKESTALPGTDNDR